MGYKFIPRPCKHTLVRNASREEAALLSFSSKQEKYDAILLSLETLDRGKLKELHTTWYRYGYVLALINGV